jgi:hypothetical protein
MKRLIFFLFGFLFIRSSFAQFKKEQISFLMENVSLKHNPTFPLYSYNDHGGLQIGVMHQHRFKYFNLTSCYTQWNINPNQEIGGLMFEDNAFNPYTYYINPYTQFSPKYLESRKNYKFIELGLGKSVYYKRHELGLLISSNYAWGKNIYMEYIYYLLSGSGSNAFWEGRGTDNSEVIKTHYWGYSGKLQYNYFLKKNRLNVGAQIGFKYLFKYDHTQIELGLKTGYNFDWGHKKKK